MTQDDANGQAIMKFGPGAVEDPFVQVKQFHDHHREGDRPGCQREALLHWFGLRHRAQIDCGKLITDLMNKLAPETLSEAVAGEDLYTKVKGLITELITDLMSRLHSLTMPS